MLDEDIIILENKNLKLTNDAQEIGKNRMSLELFQAMLLRQTNQKVSFLAKNFLTKTTLHQLALDPFEIDPQTFYQKIIKTKSALKKVLEFYLFIA